MAWKIRLRGENGSTFIWVNRRLRQKRLREARQEGRQEGEVVSLLRLLERRFREIPTEVRQRIAEADPARISEWFDRAIDAPDFGTVFRMQ